MNFLRDSKALRSFLGTALGALLIFVSGAYLGYTHPPIVETIASVIHKTPEVPLDKPVDFDPFWQAWHIIEEKYVATDKIDRQKMIWGAISGAAAALGDPYTTFFPPEEKKLFDSEVRGDFEGVGMEIGMRKGIITVIAPLKGTPAYKAGIKAGDRSPKSTMLRPQI